MLNETKETLTGTYSKMEKEIKSADELIKLISDSLSEMDGEAIAEVANSFLVCQVEYQGDSLFEIDWPQG